MIGLDAERDDGIPPEEKIWEYNNFHLFFLDMLRYEEGTLPLEHQFRLKRAWEYGEIWQVFLDQNKDLLDQIFVETRLLRVAMNLQSQYRRMFALGDYEGAARFKAENDLGEYDRIIIRLNPLLGRAHEQMKTLGINTALFTR